MSDCPIQNQTYYHNLYRDSIFVDINQTASTESETDKEKHLKDQDKVRFLQYNGKCDQILLTNSSPVNLGGNFQGSVYVDTEIVLLVATTKNLTPVLCLLVTPTKVHHLTLVCIKLHLPPLSPALQLIYVSLQPSASFVTIFNSADLGVVRKFTNTSFYALIQVIYKNDKQQWTQH
ncbi:uncharacterized protein LOC132207171 isoform X2 [Stegostoma tigrinum]|uniref:uncharacterized protein LOC132207171 isoform X2 n=1 Tax=Stegostoma tigrinum TaxID=3053191 RepID=UPI00286FCD56|nr:uncharacterized protein LOC132207171 isoform X2 [Stegostoma tigrinum]